MPQPRAHAYAKLNRTTGEIRLLHLQPAASNTNPVKCYLLHAPLEDTDRTPYEALSYTWGISSRSEAIQLGDHGFLVTENLKEALLALRDPHSTRVLWIDAICINQDDVEERAHEVLRMLRIYQLASRVVVWLGAHSDNSELAMQHFHELDLEWRLSRDPAVRTRVIRLLKSVISRTVALGYGLLVTLMSRYLISAWNIIFFLGWVPLFSRSGLVLDLVRLVTGFTLFDMVLSVWAGYRELRTDLANDMATPPPEIVKALAAFFARTWFRRAWIVQEVAAAQDLIILCGSAQIHVISFFNATHAIDRRVANTSTRSAYVDSGYVRGAMLRVIVNKAAIGSLGSIGGADFGARTTRADRLLNLLQQFRFADATDDRDKIYCLLGLSSFAQDESGVNEDAEDNAIEKTARSTFYAMLKATGRLKTYPPGRQTGPVEASEHPRRRY
ncbi:heterokaryon incompatibility protein-domain-containing protein [Microdochium bolleyi]|uniref:Heterokaryon incompatibility protein-domain-containing protein n=1 Tax=Microdochium bolleyi TaxID=196109 RepID=A0A136J8F5_9PEZI|nr:heterokaryon incompatibility protein-domain-containing protein [Microdochium bolleyi]